MGDESWIYSYSYDPGTKQQSLQWKSPQSSRAGPSSTKIMLIVFSAMKDVACREFVPPSTMVNFDFYCEVLRCWRENVRRKRPKL
jgi:hypothetical protein